MKTISYLEEKPIRIDHFLTQVFPNFSRSNIQKYIKSGNVLVNGFAVKKTGHLVQYDDVIDLDNDDNFFLEKITLDTWNNSNIINLIVEEEDYLILNKPTSLIVHPATGNWNQTLSNALIAEFDTLDFNLVNRPGIVHRLDKDTSGVIIISKNNNFTQLIQSQFKNRIVKKKYVAFVQGVLNVKSGIIDAPIGTDPSDFHKMKIDGNNSKEAITHFELIKTYDNFSLVAFYPLTGRTHQLRVHSQFIGHPIMNDSLYTKNKEKITSFGQYLHAYKVSFLDASNNKKEYYASFPKEFIEIEPQIEKLVNDTEKKS